MFGNFSVGLNYLDYEFKKLTFRSFLLVLNHICQSRIKVACKVEKSFLTLFPLTLVRVEVQSQQKVFSLKNSSRNCKFLVEGTGWSLFRLSHLLRIQKRDWI